jgi:hypothetical protein
MSDNCIDLHHNIRMEVYSQKDSFLVENFIKQGASSPESTSMIQCRNFLRVSRMSKIATGCGPRIPPRMYNGMNQKGTQPISGQSNQDHQKGHGRYGRSNWVSWRRHKQRFPCASHWVNGKMKHPGPFGNITSCPTICISSIVK